MAAKPPKPPGSFLKSLLNQHNNKNQQQQNHDDDDHQKESHCCLQNSTTGLNSTTTIANLADSNLTTQIAAAKKNNCNCSNISIMHLFHEMKQEFPTLPDTIVAQCVNENCHQRENCIQMLKHELELNPIPAQSYPAKVLHPPNNTNNNLQNTTTTTTVQKPPLQQKPLVVQQKPPLKPIKPTRTAPLQPPQQQQTNGKINCTKTNSTLNKNTNNKSLSVENLQNNEEFVGNGAGGAVDTNSWPIKITPPFKQSITTTTTTNSTASEVCNDENDKYVIGSGDENIEKHLPRQRPTTLNLNTQLQKQQQQQRQRLNIQLQQRFQEQRNRQQLQNNNTTITKPLRKAPLPPIAPKPAQLQLNHNNANAILNDSLHTSTSPLSESEISVSVSLSTPSPTSSSLSPNTTTHHHLLNKTTQPQAPATNQQQQQQQHHHHLQTKSPIRHRSVITLQPEPPYTRDFLFTPNSSTYASTTPPAATSPTLAVPKSTTATNSSSSATSSPTASVAGSQKSFTSVNLTLRPPVSPNGPNSALQPSTIDITAGPGFSGASGGGKSLHYSSTSYDARLGYQQNFQITVTDECGVFTASRIRPQQQQQQQQRGLNQVNIKNDKQYDDNSDNYINSLFNAQQQQQQQQQQQLQLQLQQQFHNNNVVALQQNIQNSIQTPLGGNTPAAFGSGSGSGGGLTPFVSGNMCFPPQQPMDAPSREILQRQKKKRDKLAAALREYKKRLGNVEQEINLLTGTIPTEGLSERLDEEITKLRRDCQDMLRSSNTFPQPHLQQELAINYQPQQTMCQQHQQLPQPFPRQKATRPPQRPVPPRQTSLDIIQHHSQTASPHTPPAASLPNLSLYSSLQLQQLQHSNHSMPPYYHQQSAPLNHNFVNNNENFYTDQSTYVEQDHVIDDDADEYEEVVEQPWECNMCTFRNHPQLNICETCENVRILPGRLTNLSRALSAANFTNPDATASNVSPTLGLLRGSSANNVINNSNSRTGLNAVNGNLEHDTNLVQQQLQHFALHT